MTRKDATILTLVDKAELSTLRNKEVFDGLVNLADKKSTVGTANRRRKARLKKAKK